jgi:hypothetical protein
MKKYLILLIIGIMFISCEINKSIVLYPVEPFEFYDNDILFCKPEIQNLWITFQAPLVKYSPGAYFRAIIRTNQNIENVHLRAISLNIKELNLSFNKILMISIPNIASESDNPKYFYIGAVSEELFTTNELKNEYDPNIPLNKLYSKFSKVKDIEYHLTVIYNIDNQYFESELIWKYNCKKKTSLAWWDAIMGI